MKIRMKTTMVGPNQAPAGPGQVIEVEEARGKALIGAGAAEKFEDQEEAKTRARAAQAGAAAGGDAEEKKKYVALKGFQFQGEKYEEGEALELTAEEAEKLVAAEKVAPAAE